MGEQKRQQKAVQPIFNINEKGFIEALVDEGGIKRNFVKAYLQQASGSKTFEEARDSNELPPTMTSVALSSKINTGLKRVLRATVFADQIAAKQAKIDAKAERENSAKVKKWKQGRRGRPPVGCGRSIAVVNAEAMVKTAHQETRVSLGLNSKGRVAASLKEEYEHEFYAVHLPANIAYYSTESEISKQDLIAQLTDEDRDLLAAYKGKNKKSSKAQKPQKKQAPVEAKETKEATNIPAPVPSDEVPFIEEEDAEEGAVATV